MEPFKTTAVTLDNSVVDGCLIGLPSANGKEYTIGVPKEDTHSWLDKAVTFWGRNWRTMGFPETAEHSNIPLGWGQNVKVRLCENAGGITVYEAESHAKHYYSMAEYNDLRGRKVDRTGAQPADNANVLIYSCTDTDGYRPRAGDIIVNGESSFTFSGTTEQEVSASMALFRQTYPDYAVIKTVSAERNGLLDDLMITAG